MKIKDAIRKELSFFWSLPAIVWQLLFVIAPAAIILFFSIVQVTDSFLWPRLTMRHYIELLDPIYFKIMFRSLVLAFATAVTCLFCAYPVAYFLALRARRFKGVLLFFLTLPFWVNFLVQIYAWYYLLERDGLINMVLMRLGLVTEPTQLVSSQFAIYIVMAYCYLPFMIMPLYSMLEKIDRRLLEASADLGATAWQTFTRVTLPLTMPGIRTGFLLVLVPAFGEFVIPSLLGGGKYMMVGSLISYFFLNARNNSSGGAFTYLSALFLLGALFLVYMLGRLIRKTMPRGTS